jgi:hypothetical protein
MWKRCSKCDKCSKEEPKKDPEKKCCAGKILCLMFFSLICGCMLGIHRNVIKACITGSEMPAAPKWHCWCK